MFRTDSEVLLWIGAHSTELMTLSSSMLILEAPLLFVLVDRAQPLGVIFRIGVVMFAFCKIIWMEQELEEVRPVPLEAVLLEIRAAQDGEVGCWGRQPLLDSSSPLLLAVVCQLARPNSVCSP